MSTKFALTHKKLFEELHPTKNALSATEIQQLTSGSSTRVWWVGVCGHEWQAAIRNRTVKEYGCPYCSNQSLLQGFNDLASVNPILSEEWHPVKNGDLEPSNVLATATRTAWWFGICGHEWESKIRRRNEGAGCPVCLHRLLQPGINDFQTEFPLFAEEWDESNDIKPNEITQGCKEAISWKCRQGHNWKLSPNQRAQSNSQCPYCSGLKVLPGYNDLTQTHPLLILEWDYSNTSKPTQFLAGSHYKAYWSCKNCSHRWRAAIVARTREQTKCPACTNRVIIKNQNDFASQKPGLSKEWDPVKNTIGADNIAVGSAYKAWWLCEKGHSWRATIRSRVSGNGCPLCSGAITSKIEQKLRNSLAHLLQLKREDHLSKICLPGFNRKVQIDILGTYKGFKVAIEYDGSYYHNKSFKKDTLKTFALLQEGYIVARIREKPLADLHINNSKFFQISYLWSLKDTAVASAVTEIQQNLDRIIELQKSMDSANLSTGPR